MGKSHKTMLNRFKLYSKRALMDYLAASCSIFQCFIWGNVKHMIEQKLGPDRA